MPKIPLAGGQTSPLPGNCFRLSWEQQHVPIGKGEHQHKTPSGTLTFHLFAALAEFERDLLCQRVTAGLAAARRCGHVGGRPTVLIEAELKKARALLRSGEYTRVQVARELNVSRHTLGRALAREART